MLALFIGIACASVGTIALILIFGDLSYYLTVFGVANCLICQRKVA